MLTFLHNVFVKNVGSEISNPKLNKGTINGGVGRVMFRENERGPNPKHNISSHMHPNENAIFKLRIGHSIFNFDLFRVDP